MSWNARSGFRRSSGLYELLVLDEEIEAAVVRQESAGRIRTAATARGMRTLSEDGLRLLRMGTTTVDEVLRAGGG